MDILDTNVAALMRPSLPPDGIWDRREQERVHREIENERLRSLNQVLLAVRANGSISYLDAYQRFEEIALDAPNINVRDAIKQLDGVKGSDVRQDLATLQGSAKAAARVQEHRVRLLDQVLVDDQQRVRLLDGPFDSPPQRVASGTPAGGPTITPSTYESVMNQPVHSQRLHRARAITGGYQEDAGARQFQQADRSFAEKDLDLVASLELAAGRVAAEATGAAVSAQLDAAFSRGSTPKERKRLCEQAAGAALRMLDQGVA